MTYWTGLDFQRGTQDFGSSKLESPFRALFRATFPSLRPRDGNVASLPPRRLVRPMCFLCRWPCTRAELPFIPAAYSHVALSLAVIWVCKICCDKV